jgi:Plant mobile domain
MIDGEASRWDDISFAIPLRYYDHQLEWTRYILMRESSTLQRAGVYDIIFLSMFSYHIDTTWLWAFCERWNYSTNSLFVDDRELTPTLWEVRQLTGLPIFGHYYDEFIVSDEDFMDTSYFTPSLRRVYEIFYQLRGTFPSVPLRRWIIYFTDRLRSRFSGPASVRDPFGTGQSGVFFEGPKPTQDLMCSHDLDRETYLTAFLSWWICFFILPSSSAYHLRPSVFVMASMIARGERVSLAVPVLANIYRGLRGLTSSRRPSHCRELIPWHLVSGWLHMHWSGLYHPLMARDMREELPILGDLAGVQPTAMSPENARHLFHRSRDHLRFAHSRLATHHVTETIHRSVTDSRVPYGGMSLIRERPDDLDYLISIRQGFLPLRLGDHIFIEPYSPHRCAHQFGLDQDIPAPHFRPTAMAADLEGLGWCYTHLFRMETDTRCHMVSITRAPTFSRRYIQWYHSAIRSYQSYPPSTVIHSTCPRGGGTSQSLVDLAATDYSPFPAIDMAPADFLGLDSRFSRLPARTLLTGISIHPFMSHSLLLHGHFDHFGLFCL